jgi:cyclophilin family peptidyl-prolyl cis-trans isomerase
VVRQPVVWAFSFVAFVVFVVACGGGGAKSFAEACKKSDQKQFAAPPDLIIDTSKTYVATISTERGDIVLELFSDVPVTTNNFVFLACKGFYDGVTFHRVIPGFVAQGGEAADGSRSGPGYTIPDEDDGDHTMDAEVISMARKNEPDSASSQFFITYTPQNHLDRDFAVFGKLTEGRDVLDQLTPRNPGDDPGAPPGDVIETITIEER